MPSFVQPPMDPHTNNGSVCDDEVEEAPSLADYFEGRVEEEVNMRMARQQITMMRQQVQAEGEFVALDWITVCLYAAQGYIS